MTGGGDINPIENDWDPARPGIVLLDLLREEVRTKGEPSVERIAEIASLTGTTSAKVKGAIGYYAELKPDESTIRVCIGEACRARGAEDVIQELESSGENVGSLHCAGLCASGPAVVRDESFHGIPVSRTGTGMQFYISQDSISLDKGSEEIAVQLLQNAPSDSALIRTGSRGIFNLEPMLELDIDAERHAFGPLSYDELLEILSLLESGDASEHSKSLGNISELPVFAAQQRFAMANLGEVNPLDIDGLRARGSYSGLAKAREVGTQGILAEIEKAGLRGRGGAGFPTHFKWASAATEEDDVKYVVANADEGDAGTFIDRMIIEGDPHAMIEGMAICAEAIGARYGWVYLRSEYPNAEMILDSALQDAREEGILGEHFDITVALGAGSYVCGEETALLESLEGRRGEVRARPPYPTQSGLYGRPTVVNNVLTFALVAAIMRVGGELYGSIGTERSKGTVVAQIVGAVNEPVCIEIPFGGTVAEMIRKHSDIEGIVAVQAGGPLGGVFDIDELDSVELSFEGLSESGGLLGHGGFVCYDSDFDPRSEVIGWMEFFRDESCGKCTPCRIGTQRALELLRRIGTSKEKAGDRQLLEDLDDVMTSTSLCALGGLAMMPIRSTMQKWPASFGGGLNE